MLDKSDWSVFVGLGSCAIGGIIIYCYKNASWHLKALQKVEEYEVGNELLKKVQSAGGNLPYVAVYGLASADDKTIQGKHNLDMEGIISNIKIKEHKSKWNPATKTWNDAKRVISSSWKTEPFSLVNGRSSSIQGTTETVRIGVKNPRSAYTLDLSKIADRYEPIGSSTTERVIDYVTGEQIKGIQTIEKMLVSHSALTAIGEVRLTTDGQLTINLPSDDSLRYYITTDSVQDLINSEKGLMLTLKILGITFFVIGGAFSIYWLQKKYEKYLEIQKYVQSRKQMQEFNERTNTDGTTCTICLSEPRDVVFLPCGHICVCSGCSERVEKCPVCRGSIDSRAAVFYS